jgi:hypothetical protein
MRHTVRMHGVIVGYSELEHAEPEVGRAWGVFRPGVGYELVQPVFQLFREAVPMKGGEAFDEIKLGRYHAAREKLGLELVDGEGRVVETSALHIADYPPEKGGMELEALIRDAEFWEAR